MGQQSNNRWPTCQHCGAAWPKKLTGEWVVIRPDRLLEAVMLCPCGKTVLHLKAQLTEAKICDLERAKRGEMTSDDMEAFAANLYKITARRIAQERCQPAAAVCRQQERAQRRRGT